MGFSFGLGLAHKNLSHHTVICGGCINVILCRERPVNVQNTHQLLGGRTGGRLGVSDICKQLSTDLSSDNKNTQLGMRMYLLVGAKITSLIY